MRRIGEIEPSRIAQNSCGFLKRNTVLGLIADRLVRVPDATHHNYV
jgi:hypothetical protein